MSKPKSRDDKFTYGDDDNIIIRDKNGKVISGDPEKGGMSKKDKKPAKSKKGSVDITPVQRSALIRLASTLEVGDPRRVAILAGLAPDADRDR